VSKNIITLFYCSLKKEKKEEVKTLTIEIKKKVRLTKEIVNIDSTL
jgi:hypothetical protein